MVYTCITGVCTDVDVGHERYRVEQFSKVDEDESDDEKVCAEGGGQRRVRGGGDIRALRVYT